VTAATVARASRQWAAAAVFPVVGLAVGAALTALASAFGEAAPLVMVGLPLAPVVAVAVFLDPRLAVAGAFATVPVGTMGIGNLPVQLILLVTGGFAGIVGLRRLMEGVAPVAWAPVLWWPLALVAWAVLGFPGAADGGLAVRQIAQLAGGVLFAALVLAAVRTPRDARWVVGAFLAVGFAVAVMALAGGQDLEARFGGAHVTGRAQGPFAQPNELGSFCAPMALVAVAVALSARRPRVRMAAAGTGLLLVAALALSLSRGAWIGFAMGLGVLLLTMPQARRALGVLTPVLLLVGLGMGAFAPSNPQVEVIGARLQSISGERNPYDSRPAIWREARREAVANPLFGEGAGSFPVASVASTSESRTTYASHAHNLLLTWAAETGLPGAGLLVAFGVHLGVVASRARRAAQRGRRWHDVGVVAGVGAALVAVAGQGLVDYTLRNSVLLVTVFGLVGVLAAMHRRLPRPGA
jgi:putative inorganic carbon (HCO3(-)) transporter